MRTLISFFTLVLLLAGQPPRGRHHDDESFAERRVHDLTRRFDLTESQRRQALTIFTDADRSAEPLEDRLEQARRNLREATHRNANHAEIDQLAAVIGNLIGQLESINAKADTAFHNTLSDKQREVLPRGPKGRKGPPRPPR